MRRQELTGDTCRDRGGAASGGRRPGPAGEKARLVKEHFTRVAKNYDLMNTLLSFGLHHLWKRTAVRLLKLQPGQRVIDVCGGTADLALLAARAMGEAGRVVVYDINPAMLAAGRAKVGRSPLAGRILWVQGDAEELSCPAQCFDAALVGFGIRNLTRPEAGFQEMHRVLKPGGKVMCLEFSTPGNPWFRWLYDRYSFALMPLAGRLLAGAREAYTYLAASIRGFAPPEEVAAMLAGAGFSQVRYRRLSDGIAVVHLAVKI